MRYIVFIAVLFFIAPCFAGTNRVVVTGAEQNPVVVKVVDSESQSSLQLLQKISDNTEGHGDTLLIALIGAGAAILGGALQSFASFQVTRLQLRGSTLTPERLRWLHDAKKELVDLYAEMDMQFSHLQRIPPQLTPQQMDEMSKNIMRGTNAVLLSLSANQEKNPHQAVVRKGLNMAMRLMVRCFSSPNPGRYQWRYAYIKSVVFHSFGKVAEDTWAQAKTFS